MVITIGCDFAPDDPFWSAHYSSIVSAMTTPKTAFQTVGNAFAKILPADVGQPSSCLRYEIDLPRIVPRSDSSRMQSQDSPRNRINSVVQEK